ncbi:hypothetical protein LCGC14_1133610 [marine sediment metagenome]|uniref:Uncharacterized protein n=1 Tax=marine sediment metagenome TaxID=412755 RepID=A0A0F9Q682_9ZZZZ
MNRIDIEDHVEEAVSSPVLARRIQKVVKEIEETVPRDKTREMMYELVDIVLQMGQRVRTIEIRVVGYDTREELSKKKEHLPKRKIDYGVDFPRDSEHASHRK